MTRLVTSSVPDASSAVELSGVGLRLFEASPECIVVVDRAWRFRLVNRRATELLGVPDLVGRNLFEAFPGNLEEPYQSAYRRAMEDATAGKFEAYYPAPLDLWFEVAVEPDADGILIYFADISARKQVELREQETADRLTQVLELTSDAIVTLDRDWRFTLLNQRASALLDPEHRLLGKVLWDTLTAVRGGNVERVLRRTMDEGVTGRVAGYYPAPVDRHLEVVAERMEEGVVIFVRDTTEEVSSHALLSGQRELLTVVQRAARMSTWEFDRATGAFRYGPGSSDLFGYAMHEVNRLDKLMRIVQPDHRQRLQDSVEESFRTRSLVVLEFAATAADGTLVWIESRSKAVDESDTMVRGMSLDVTQRKLDEQERSASEARFRVLTDLNPQAIWAGDAAGNITYANQSFLAYIGLTLENLDGAGWLAAFGPDDRDRVLQVWMHSVATGEDYDTEALIRHAGTGELRFWHLHAAAVHDANGAIVQWLGVGTDVHDVKTSAAAIRAEQAEAERRRAELEAVYVSTPVALALLDPVEFRFLRANDLEAELLGMPVEQLLGRKVEEVAPDLGSGELLTSVAQGRVVKDMLLEGALEATGNLRRYWSVNYSPVYGLDGEVRAISSAVVEITNQKRAESALVQSEKLAAVGRLASSISHEINNPLEAITNLLYLIAQDGSLPDELKIFVHMAQSELSRVSQIATQTLRFHRQAVNPTHVTAEDLVGAVVRLYTGRLANSSIHVDARYSTHTRILCFENDIRQVLNNLIANAIDAMRHGGRLAIRAHEATDCTGRSGVRITIGDTGHGMTPEILLRVFEPFYTTKDLNGTGLGLWISAGIVERHQGRLTVRSSVDAVRHGTVFTLFLPCKEVATA